MGIVKYLLSGCALLLVAASASGMFSEPEPAAPAYPKYAPYNVDLSRLPQAFGH